MTAQQPAPSRLTAAGCRFLDLANRLRITFLAMYIVLAAGLFSRVWIHPTRQLVGDAFSDAPQFEWFLRWTEFALVHHQNPLVTTYINHPEGVNLMWSASMPLPGALLSPVTALLGPLVSYNLWMTLSLALSAWTAMLAIRRWVPNSLAAAGGGLLFGFSPYMIAHSLGGHPNLVFAVYPPLLLLLLDEVLVRRRWSALVSGTLLGLLTAAQLLVAEEMVASSAVAAAVVVGWLAVLYRARVRSTLGHAARSLSLGVVVALVLTGVPLAVQFFGPLRAPSDIHFHNLYVNDLLNFVVPTSAQRLAPAAALKISERFTGNVYESNGYFGAPLLLVLGFVAVTWWRLPIVRLATLSGLTLVVLSLGPYLHVGGHDTRIPLPYQVLDMRPVFRNLIPSRLVLYADLGAALLLAVFLERGLQRRSRGLMLAALGVAACVLIPLVPGRSPWVAADTPPFFSTSVPRHLPEDSVLLVAPSYGCPPSALPMLWQSQSGMHFRIIGGYFVGPEAPCSMALGSRSTPVSDTIGALSDGKAAPPLTSKLRHALVAELSSRRVSSVVVGPMPNQRAMLSFLTELYGYPPDQDGGVYVWWTLPGTAG